jgi:hypothetical protein
MWRVLALGLLVAGCGEAPELRKVTIVGSQNLLPGLDAPFAPSFAEMLVAEAEVGMWTLRVTGNGRGMALICRLPLTVTDPLQPEAAALAKPDVVLMTRPPAPPERAYCAQQSVDIGVLKLADYTGTPGRDPELDGLWMVWDRRQEARSPETARVVDVARQQTPRLLGTSAYAGYFRAR